MKLINKIWQNKYLYPLALILIGIILATANYTPNTFLSGWDTLHPEFNFPLAFSRIFTGVWRTDQGLGAVAGHSHMADLPRTILLWLSGFILPQEFIRYLFFAICLIAGPLGVYKLTKKLINDKYDNIAALLSGLTYLTNLGTLQHFIVPFEMFTVAYALIPWIFYSSVLFIEKTSRKNYLILS